MPFPYSGLMLSPAAYAWNPIDLAKTCAFWTARVPTLVRSIKVRVDVAGTNASAVTGVIRKVPAGTALTGGVAIHSGTINLKGAANSVTELTLSATAADLMMADGDSLVFALTGTSTAAQGVATVHMEAAST